MSKNIGKAPKLLPPALFLMGPTASGKTDLAIKICENLPCEIISVDSALIYRSMDIGTAKPTAEELKKTPHKLIDILDPAQSYSVAEFRKDALSSMQDITARGNIPLLVGGTMMYYKALIDGEFTNKSISFQEHKLVTKLAILDDLVKIVWCLERVENTRKHHSLQPLQRFEVSDLEVVVQAFDNTLYEGPRCNAHKHSQEITQAIRPVRRRVNGGLQLRNHFLVNFSASHLLYKL